MDIEQQEIFVGIEIGGTKLQLVTGDNSATILERVRYSINPARGAIGIREQIEEGLQTLLTNKKVRSIGVGFGGPIDWKTGAIQLSHQIEGWGNFNLKEWLQQLTELPVAVDNDANTAALGEAKKGCGKGEDVVFYMTVGSGIGGGIVIKEEIYHGRIPGEVEIGHIRLNKQGDTLESKCSGWAVNQTVKEYILSTPHSLLATLAASSPLPESYLLTPALQQNDTDAKIIINKVADNIAFALSHVVHLFNPDVIIIGGGLSMLKEYLRIPVTEKLPQYLLKALLPAPQIKMAALGEDVVPIGALELAKKIFDINSKQSINH
jgi:glucokinase